MHTLKSSLPLAGAATMVSTVALALTLAAPANAAATAEQLATAEQACVTKAQTDGYTLNDVVSNTAKDADTVEVVLDLTKTADGTQATLTCPYSLSQGVVGFGEAANAVGGAVSPSGLGRLWWLLLPLLGLPLLLWAVRGRGATPLVAAGDRVYAEGYVNTHGENLDIREHPTKTARVTGSLRDGEHVYLSGRHNNGWVELKHGGWVPNYYLRYAEAVTRAAY